MKTESTIALIYPFYSVSSQQTQDVPLGICQIKSKLYQQGYDSKVFDLNFSNKSIKYSLLSNIEATKLFILNGNAAIEKNLCSLICRHDFDQFDIFCFSIFSFEQLLVSLALSKVLKERNKKIIFGGSFCKDNKQLMEDFKFIDFMVTDTGELGVESVVKILEGGLDEENLKNIIYREKDSSVKVSNVKNDVHMTSLPDFQDLDLDNYRDANGNLEIPYGISIGCALRCHYCTSHANQYPLYKDPKQIAKDLKYLKDKYRASRFFLICNFFNTSDDYMNDVASELLPLDIEWATCVIYKDISIETLRVMKKSGCRKLLMGLESGSQKMLDSMNKKVKLESCHLFKKIDAVGIKMRVNIILDLPGEGKRDILETAIFLKRHQEFIERVHFMMFQLNKGAYIFNNLEQFNMKLIKNESDPFGKYLYFHSYTVGSDKTVKPQMLEDYGFYDIIKPFIYRYKSEESKKRTSSFV